MGTNTTGNVSASVTLTDDIKPEIDIRELLDILIELAESVNELYQVANDACAWSVWGIMERLKAMRDELGEPADEDTKECYFCGAPATIGLSADETIVRPGSLALILMPHCEPDWWLCDKHYKKIREFTKALKGNLT